MIATGKNQFHIVSTVSNEIVVLIINVTLQILLPAAIRQKRA